ncbi:hypothetical protein BiPBO1_41 [Brucella phage BiPBO1]|uniref:hypothetical protein n=1 Tax=Brucella phage BiPBO1 TaxID=1718278 RepID=UPI00031F34CA|nr:hypothetical protein BJD47_gp41 [Brucella phage BiPBO1]ALJ98255.1 hypothetical protein BiPBO1_41 [Brucella phage BiPBO1]
MDRLTWGDILVASFSACLACGPDEPVEKRTLSADLEKILQVSGRAREGRAALRERE